MYSKTVRCHPKVWHRQNCCSFPRRQKQRSYPRHKWIIRRHPWSPLPTIVVDNCTVLSWCWLRVGWSINWWPQNDRNGFFLFSRSSQGRCLKDWWMQSCHSCNTPGDKGCRGSPNRNHSPSNNRSRCPNSVLPWILHPRWTYRFPFDLLLFQNHHRNR